MGAAFLAERCTLDPERTRFGGHLYAASSDWAQASGAVPVTRKRFDAALTEAGLERCHGYRAPGGAVWRSSRGGPPTVATGPPTAA